MATRKERIISAVLDLASELEGSWGLAIYRCNFGYMTTPYGCTVLLGPVGEALRVDPIRHLRPRAWHPSHPVLPYERTNFQPTRPSLTSTSTIVSATHRSGFFPKEHQPRLVLMATRTPIKGGHRPLADRRHSPRMVPPSAASLCATRITESPP